MHNEEQSSPNNITVTKSGGWVGRACGTHGIEG